MPEETKSTKLSMDDLREMIRGAVSETVDSMKTEKAENYEDRITARHKEYRAPGPQEKGIGAARLVRALAFGAGNPDKAMWFAQKAWDDDLGDTVTKALAAGDFTAGGFMVPDDMAADIIDLLRPRSVVRAAGAPTVPMPNGTLTLPKQTGDVSATYVGENKAISASEPTGGQIILSAKKLAAMTPISNDLLDYAPGTQADVFVRNSLVRRVATREDAAFIRDDGSAGTPRGLRHWAQAANVTATNGSSTSALVELDFKDLIQDLEGNNVDMSGPAWFMAPRSKNHLLTLRDTNGNLIYPELRSANPTIHTFPIYVTNNIPTNLGAGSNESELYLVNMPDTLIGEAGGLEIEVDPGASYTDGGSLVSAFERDQTVIRAILRHDFAVLHGESVAVKTGVTWGS